MNEKQLMLVAVACRNASGQPDMPVFEVEVGDEEQRAGDHYEAAKRMAGEAGYEGPYICFDHSEQSALLQAVKRLKLVPSLVVVDNSGGAIHGVWGDAGGKKAEVIALGTDLEQLAYEHGIEAKAVVLAGGAADGGGSGGAP